jgi:phage terminase large subunit-like protein
MGEEERLRFIDSLTDEECAAFLYDWEVWGRGQQLEPYGDWWLIWIVLAGRGFGKTRTGAEWVKQKIESGECQCMALVARTSADVRDVMVLGPAGLLSICPPWNMPKYEPSKRRIIWPNGQLAMLYSADKPDLLRGPQHDGAWADEVATWKKPAAWDNLMMGLRLGKHPRCIVTTTPRPTRLVRDLLKSSTTVVSRGTTFDNLENLAPTFEQQVLRKYIGTRLGRQELYAEVLTDIPGALWTYEMFDDRPEPPPLVRVVVGVDPSVRDDAARALASGKDPDDEGDEDKKGDDCGIIVAGLGEDMKGYVLEDRTVHEGPLGWARAVGEAYDDLKADYVVAEANQGGDMVMAVLKTVRPDIPVKLVYASRGKYVRAQPVASLYEQNRVKHINYFDDLEEELTSWTPLIGWSPNRLDALVWAFTELMVDDEEEEEGVVMYEERVRISPV